MHDFSLLVEHFPYAGLFILLILGGIGLPFPEDATLILCGFLLSQTIIKPMPGLLVVYSGLLIADLLLYHFGRKFGRKIVTHKRFQRILSPERFSKIEEQFKRRGSLFILIGRHFIGLRAQIFIVAGVMRMSALKFSIADAVSAIFTIAIMVGAGYAGGNSLQVIKKDISRIEHVAVFVLITMLVIYLFARYVGSGDKGSGQTRY
ncbi:MAG: DedA family protein [Nitrospirae bacterium]|nr:DedA family protein [Nitrospirota bacterium]